jgi:glycosyltransferase involved in cell wall biosynthesis
MKRKILFLGETYRADAITWINGLKDFGNFEVITWELKTPSDSLINRLFEFAFCIFTIQKMVRIQKPDLVIAERVTSYGFLAAVSGVKKIAIAQQGISDLWPEHSILYPLKKSIQNKAFQKATLIHAWGEVMIPAMKKANVPLEKILILPKGINLEQFQFVDTTTIKTIKAIVTRSLLNEYRHEVILESISLLKKQNINCELTIVGDGKLLNHLKQKTKALGLEKEVIFLGRILNHELPIILQKHNFYISMPTTEGVSGSLFEAMASGCYPIVSDIAGNQHFIKNNSNGNLIPVDDVESLAKTIFKKFEDIHYREKAIFENRKFVEQNANYEKNMTQIAEKYHQIIDTTI